MRNSERVFVDLGIQHAMGHTVIRGLPGSLQHFSTLSHKLQTYGKKKKKLLNLKCVF
jgi:hypothetical protein